MSGIQYGKRLFTRALNVLQSPARKEGRQKNAAQRTANLSSLAELPGFIGGCLVDPKAETARTFEIVRDTLDLESVAINNIAVMNAAKDSISSLTLDDQIDDIVISLVDHYHLMRPLKTCPSLFVYVILDKSSANLGLTRITLRSLD